MRSVIITSSIMELKFTHHSPCGLEILLSATQQNLPYTRIMLMMRLELRGVRFHKLIMAIFTG